MIPMDWYESEWADDGFAADVNGIEADVYPVDGGVFWSVQPSAGRCEFPELFDCGTVSTVEEAKTAAESAMTRADATYQHVSYF